MKILFFGDIVGAPGREAIKKILPQWKKKYQPDLVIANGENMAHGSGITKNALKEVLDNGVDIVTSGDHIWSQKEVFTILENKEIPLIKPANLPAGTPGKGYRIIEIRTKKILVVNLIGRVFMRYQYDDPFRTIDQILDEHGEKVNAVIVDFHAEATAEKVCLGWYLDGRVSAVLGTHTHIPTADSRVLPKGTAYITDVGMVGPQNSSLGANKDVAIKCILNQTPFDLKIADGPVEVNAVLIKIDSKGKSEKIEKLQKIVAL